MTSIQNEQSGSRLRAIADSLDCLTEQDFMLLTDATESTVEAWRKRGKGPDYILVGNRFLYARKAVSDWLHTNVRPRVTAETSTTNT